MTDAVARHVSFAHITCSVRSSAGFCSVLQHWITTQLINQ